MDRRNFFQGTAVAAATGLAGCTTMGNAAGGARMDGSRGNPR